MQVLSIGLFEGHPDNGGKELAYPEYERQAVEYFFISPGVAKNVDKILFPYSNETLKCVPDHIALFDGREKDSRRVLVLECPLPGFDGIVAVGNQMYLPAEALEFDIKECEAETYLDAFALHAILPDYHVLPN